MELRKQDKKWIIYVLFYAVPSFVLWKKSLQSTINNYGSPLDFIECDWFKLVAWRDSVYLKRDTISVWCLPGENTRMVSTRSRKKKFIHPSNSSTNSIFILYGIDSSHHFDLSPKINLAICKLEMQVSVKILNDSFDSLDIVCVFLRQNLFLKKYAYYVREKTVPLHLTKIQRGNRKLVLERKFSILKMNPVLLKKWLMMFQENASDLHKRYSTL